MLIVDIKELQKHRNFFMNSSGYNGKGEKLKGGRI
jgi:hypothetical protein